MSLSLVASGCATTPTQQQASKKHILSSEIFGLLDKTPSGYRFTKFAYGKSNRSRTEAWVNISTNHPTWNTGQLRCGIGLVKDRVRSNVLSCEDVENEKIFMVRQLDKGDIAMRAIAAPFYLGISLTGASFDVVFDQTAFDAAVAEANMNIDPAQAKMVDHEFIVGIQKINDIKKSTENQVVDGSLLVAAWPSIGGVESTLDMLVLNLKQTVRRYEQKAEEIHSRQLDIYNRDYDNAKTSADYDEFIKTYKNFDPLNKLNLAKISRERIYQEEEKERVALHEAKELNRKAEMKRLSEKIEKFRKSLRIGDFSNCGLVVNIRENVIQVQSMIGETWIKIDNVYPSGIECKFFNNVYVPPAGMPL